MQVRSLHPWRMSIREAIEVQERLAERVRLRPLPRKIRHGAGPGDRPAPPRRPTVPHPRRPAP